MLLSLLSSSRATVVVLACLAGVLLPGFAHAKDTDPNALGFKAYEKGDYKKAHGLFEKALKQNPDHAFALLNRARTTTQLNKGKENADDFEYCDYASNWIYRALADLSKAVDLNRAAVLPKIDEDQKGLKALKERAEYAKWRRAIGLLAGEANTEKVLSDMPSWLFLAPSAIPVTITLAPDKKVTETIGGDEETTAGQWALKGGQVELTPVKGKATLWKVVAEKYYFNQGTSFFFELQLVPVAQDPSASGWLAGPLRSGPLLGDCE